MLVSVVIPTFNRSRSLQDTLDSLSRQTLPAQEVEVVVVDDGSTDDTAAIARGRYPFRIRYCYQTNQGAGAARNRGAGESAGRLLVFLDDDMLLAPDYLRALAAEHDRFADILAMGVMFPWVEDAAGPFPRWAARSTPLQQTSDFVHFRACTSNNVSIEREAFFRLGMWRDVCGDGQTLWGDVELGYRAHRQGMRLRRCVEAVCFHRDYAIRDLRTQSRRMRHSARLAHALLRAYPELEAELPMFRDMSPPRWGSDPPLRVARKLLRALSATGPVVAVAEGVVALLERTYPEPAVLAPLYHWIVGASIYRGYRDGLSRPAATRPTAAEAR